MFVGKAEQVLVGDDDQRIDDLLQRLNAVLGLTHPLGAFKLEGLGHDTHGQNTQLAGRLRDDRCSTRPGAAAHAGGDKAHMRSGKVIDDLLDAFLGSRRADRRACPCPETLGDLEAHLDLRLGLGLLERLSVRIGNHELDALELFFDHVVNRVAASPAYAKYGNPGFQIFLPGHREVQRHTKSACLLRARLGAGTPCLNCCDPIGLRPSGHEKNTETPQNMESGSNFSAGYRRMSKILRITSYP